MSNSFLDQYGNATKRVERAIMALQAGQGVLLVDDEDRENEGDLIFSVEHLRVEQMALMIRECSGIVCLCLAAKTIDRLQLRQMVERNTSRNCTAFTVSIEAKEGVTTGVSAADRVHTIKTACNLDAKPEDLCQPGHVFPLAVDPGGVLARRGHTEGTLDLMILAGLEPAGILCELTNSDGTMAKLGQICEFANKHTMTVLSVEDLVQYRRDNIKTTSLLQC